MDFTVEFENVSFQYTGIGGSNETILHDINLRFDQRMCTAIVGPSGSGKTTLVQHFTGLLKPVAGVIRYNDRDIWSKPHRFAELRRRIGLVFQFPENQLFEETVRQDVAFGPKKMGCSAQEAEQRVVAAMGAVGLSMEKFAERSPFKLSEGEKRRVAIAGILAMQPGMVVMDEPTAGLDPRGVRTIIRIIETLSASGVAVVLITHNMELVARVADRVLVMQNGRVSWDGTPRALFQEPDVIHHAHLHIPRIVQLLQKQSGTLTGKDVNPNLADLENHIDKIYRNVVV